MASFKKTQMTKQSLKIAGVPEHFNLPWHLGVESEDFSQLDVDLQYSDYPGGTGAMTKALAAGEVDMAVLLTEGAVADLINRGKSKLVKTFVESPLIWGIHVAANSDIQTIDQIQGRRYAISRFGSGSHLMAIVDAAERGWDAGSLEFVVVKNLAGAREALSKDAADIFFWEQFTTQPYVDNGEFRRLGVRETLWPAFVIAVNKSVLSTKADLVDRALQVINRQCRRLMENADAVDIIADRYQLNVDQIQQWFALTKWSTDFRCPSDSIEKVIEYLNRLEIVEAPDTNPADVWHDLSR